MDPTFLSRIQAGDEEAFALLFHTYKNLVYKTACLLLDSNDEAEDALQEVFLQVLKSIGTYQPAKGAFTTWLYRITVNHCLNRRRKRRFAFLPWGDFTFASASWSFQTAGPEDGLGDEALRQGLRQLSDKIRPVVILRYYQELSYAEIAQILDIPVGTVKSRLDTGLKILRKTLNQGAAQGGVFSHSEVIR